MNSQNFELTSERKFATFHSNPITFILVERKDHTIRQPISLVLIMWIYKEGPGPWPVTMSVMGGGWWHVGTSFVSSLQLII